MSNAGGRVGAAVSLDVSRPSTTFGNVSAVLVPTALMLRRRIKGPFDGSRQVNQTVTLPRRPVGHGGHRRRGDRRRHCRRRRLARILRLPLGAERFRQGNFQPIHQACPRRGSLSSAGQHLPGHGGPQGTGHSPPKCAAPRSRSGLRRAQLRLVGSSVLRHRHEGLRHARRPIRIRQVAAAVQGRGARAHPHARAGRPPRRRPLL